MKKIVLLFIFITSYFFVQSQNGNPDPGFGINGVVKSYSSQEGSPGTSFASDAIIQEDGNLILVVSKNSKTVLHGRLPNGNTNESFGINGFSEAVSMIANAAARQPDGKIIVAGTTNGASGFILARFNPDGSLDQSFGNNGVSLTFFTDSPFDALNSLLVLPDGKVLAGGSTTNGGIQQFAIVRYTLTGALDTQFGDNGFLLYNFSNASSSSLNTLALQPDGKILAGGNAFINGNGDFALARFLPDGNPDASFNGTGATIIDYSFNDVINSILVGDSGEIYLGGYTADGNGNSRFTIARLNSDGSPDGNYNGGSGFNRISFGNGFEFLTGISFQSNGKLIAAGHSVSDPEGADILITRLNIDGTLDNTFGSLGNGLVRGDFNAGDDESRFLIIQPDNKVVTGGVRVSFTNGFELGYSGFRFEENGQPDAGFGTNGSFFGIIKSSFFQYTQLLLQNDGGILALGEQSGATNNLSFLTRLLDNGNPDANFGQNGTVELPATPIFHFQPDGKLLRLGVSDNGHIQLQRFNTDGSIDIGFGTDGTVITDLGGIESPLCVAYQPDGKFVVGGLSRDANGADFLLLRYLPNGSLDVNFGTNGFTRVNYGDDDNVLSVAIALDGKIVFGGTSLTFVPLFRSFTFVGRLNADGTPDIAFGDQGKKVIDRSTTENFGKLAIQADSKILLTSYENQNTASSQIALIRLNTDGTLDNSFGQNGTTLCDGPFILIQSNNQKILVAGSRKNNQNNSALILSRFNVDGTFDATFGNNGQVPLSIGRLENFVQDAIQDESSLFVAGSGVDEFGNNLGFIAKFQLSSPTTSLQCPGDTVVYAGDDICGAIVNGIDPILSNSSANVQFTLSGATTGSGSGSASGTTFQTGITEVKYILASDTAISCTFQINVVDNLPPVINGLSVTPSTLWPPDHSMRNVLVNYTVSDNCQLANKKIIVTSNEPVYSNEPHDQAPDWVIINDHLVKLRAERSGRGNGRTYTIKVVATDIYGNKDTASAFVTVPKSLGNPGDVNFVITAYPNPTFNHFNVVVYSTSDNRIKLRVLSLNGKVLQTVDNVRRGQTVKLGDKLKPGIYVIEATQNGMTKSIRGVKL